MTHAQPLPETTHPVKWLRMIVGIAALIVLMALLLFGAAGTTDWWQAWVYLAFYVMMLGTSRIGLYFINPDLIRERATSLDREDVPLLEKVLMLSIAIVIPLIQMLVVGLDRRYGWSPDEAPIVTAIAALALLASYLFAIWAMAVNRFYSGVVRIQHDRGQVVITTGPYALLRHPSYSAGIVAFIATGLFLGSLWSLWLLIPYCIALIWRTSREDRLLLTELEGYQEYARRVKYRLIPGIW